MPSFETFGALHLAYTTGQDYRNGFFWSSVRSGPNLRPSEVNVWLPTPSNKYFPDVPQFRSLGSYARRYAARWEAQADVEFGAFGKAPQLMIAPVSTGSGVVASPVDYQRLWFDRNTGAALNGSVWRPIPPAGYVALGDVWMSGWDTKPPLNAIWCVKESAVDGHTYVRRAELRESVWNDKGTGGNAGDVAVWRPDVAPTTEDTSERLLIAPNTVTTVLDYEVPAPTPTTWILDVPADVEKLPEPPVPALTSYEDKDIPVPEQVTNRIVRVPFTGVKDEGRSLDWKIEHSPFYRLHRRVGYKLVLFTNNKTGTAPAPGEDKVTTGIVTEEGEKWSETTTVTVSASAGIAFKGLSAGVNVNITRETGYERRTSLTQLEFNEKKQGMLTPAGSSGALWVKSHELLLYRADGSLVADGLPFDIPSYAVSNHPPVPVGEHIEFPEPAAAQFQQAPDLDWEKGGGIPGFDAGELTKKLELLRQEMPERS